MPIVQHITHSIPSHPNQLTMVFLASSLRLFPCPLCLSPNNTPHPPQNQELRKLSFEQAPSLSILLSSLEQKDQKPSPKPSPPTPTKDHEPIAILEERHPPLTPQRRKRCEKTSTYRRDVNMGSGEEEGQGWRRIVLERKTGKRAAEERDGRSEGARDGVRRRWTSTLYLHICSFCDSHQQHHNHQFRRPNSPSQTASSSAIPSSELRIANRQHTPSSSPTDRTRNPNGTKHTKATMGLEERLSPRQSPRNTHHRHRGDVAMVYRSAVARK